MFRKSPGFALFAGAITIVFAALLSTSTFAYQASATGLGQSWPNAPDVSLSANYHVYVFVRDGVGYIQINSLNGTVLAAMAIADNVVLVLPAGVDAGSVTTQQGLVQSAEIDNAGLTETIYRDSHTRISATSTDTGAVRINVATTAAGDPEICTNPANCNGVGHGRHSGNGSGGDGSGGNGH